MLRRIFATIFASALLILAAGSALARTPMLIALSPFHPTIYSNITFEFYAPNDLPANRHYYLTLITPPAKPLPYSTCTSFANKDYDIGVKKGQLVKLTITPSDTVIPTAHWCVAQYSLAGVFEALPGDKSSQMVKLGEVLFSVRK